MARLQDVVPAMRLHGAFKFIIALCKEIAADQLTTQAAAMAYAWLFAIFPFLIFLLTLFAYIPDWHKVKAQDEISNLVHRVLAPDAANAILDNLHQLAEPRSTLLVIGLIITLWVASGGMAMTMTGLDTAYDRTSASPFYIQRPMAMLLTIIIAFLILLVFLLMPVGTIIERWLAATNKLPWAMLALITFARYLLAILMTLTILSVLYNFGTRVRHPFTFCSPGAVFTTLVWFVLGSAFRFYVDKFGSYQKTYGAVGGVAIMLLFFYLDALVMLIGAEINNQIDHVLRENALADAKS